MTLLLQKTDLKDHSKLSGFDVAGENEKDAGYLPMMAYRMGLSADVYFLRKNV